MRIAITLLVLLATGLVADAKTPAKRCRQLCQPAIEACVADGGSARVCKRRAVRRCRRLGVEACEHQGRSGGPGTAPVTVTTTTSIPPAGLIDTTTTTTIGPTTTVPPPVIVSPIDFELDGPGIDVDDPCFWVDPDDPDVSFLFVTAKDSGLVEVFSAATGEFL